MKGRKNQFQRNKRNVHRCKIQRIRYLCTTQVPRVSTLKHYDPFIAAQFPGQFAVAHIHRINLFHSVLQHTVSKATGGSTDISGCAAVKIDGKHFHSLFQLETASSHIAQRIAAHFQRDGILHIHTGFIQFPVTGKYLSGHNQRLSLLAAFRQAAFRDKHVKSLFRHAPRPPPQQRQRLRHPAP